MKKRNFKFEEKLACLIIHKICTAVNYLHSLGILHRDLKPENIMIKQIKYNESNQIFDLDIKIIDFNLSKIIAPNQVCTEPYGSLVK